MEQVEQDLILCKSYRSSPYHKYAPGSCNPELPPGGRATRNYLPGVGATRNYLPGVGDSVKVGNTAQE